MGVLVQANFGAREDLLVAGVPVGQEIAELLPVTGAESPGIAVVATDAPLLPHQLKRLARRVPLGIARTGGVAENDSGDLFLAFSTANPRTFAVAEARVTMLADRRLSPLFRATVQATEGAIINALVAAGDMTGQNGNTCFALPHGRLKAILRRYHRLLELRGSSSAALRCSQLSQQLATAGLVRIDRLPGLKRTPLPWKVGV